MNEMVEMTKLGTPAEKNDIKSMIQPTNISLLNRPVIKINILQTSLGYLSTEPYYIIIFFKIPSLLATRCIMDFSCH